MKRKPYPTDRTDEQGERMQPLLPSPKSGTPRRRLQPPLQRLGPAALRLAGDDDGQRAGGVQDPPWRWVVEHTFGWLVRYRRLLVAPERLPETREAIIVAAMPPLMRRRLQSGQEFQDILYESIGDEGHSGKTSRRVGSRPRTAQAGSADGSRHVETRGPNRPS